MIPDPSGQLAELIVHITSTIVDIYSHQVLLGISCLVMLLVLQVIPNVFSVACSS